MFFEFCPLYEERGISMGIVESEFIVFIAMYLVFIVIATILFIKDIKKAKQEERRIKPVYIVLFGISWGIIAVIAIIYTLFYFLIGIGFRGM